MALLKEYIGALLSEINDARVMSDIKTKQVALAYAKDEVLKNFTVPYFRTPEIEITAPVALDSLSITSTKANTIENKNAFKNDVIETLKLHYKTSAIPATDIKKTDAIVNNHLEELISRLEKEENKTVALKKFNDSIIAETSAPLAAFIKIKSMDARGLQTKLNNILLPHITPVKQDIREATVIAETAKLKDTNPQNLIYIKIKLRENGMEWLSLENSDGSISNRLMPE